MRLTSGEGLFAGFRPFQVPVDGAVINGVIGGSGPPVLLLHGYPQTHAAWHRIAPALAESHTVIAADLTGYGESIVHGPTGIDRFSKAAMARDQVAAMRTLGFDRFPVVGHDRGGRVGYRMALDFPAAVQGFSSITVIPTSDMWAGVDKGFAMGAYHWFLFAQPFDLPERLIGAAPDYYLDYTLKRAGGGSLDIYHPDALARYRQAFRDPAVRHAICQDYRAAAGIDAEADAADFQAGRKITCPVQILWSARRIPSALEQTPLDIWARWAENCTGQGIAAGHYMPEEAPEEVLAALRPFLDSCAPS